MIPFSRKGLLVAGVHLAIVGALGGKLLIDRATLPRAWARAVPIDPNLPIRGRYVRLGIEAIRDAGATFPAPDSAEAMPGRPPRSGGAVAVPRPVRGLSRRVPVDLVVREGRLFAANSSDTRGVQATVELSGRDTVIVLVKPLAYFISEHVEDPSLRQPGEELWAEVTVPRKGSPRPIRLGVMRDGVITPLHP